MHDGEIPPVRLAELLAEREVALIDVREEWESQLCGIEGSVSAPMSRWRTLADAEGFTGLLAEASGGRPAVLYCKSGARSGQLLGVLRSIGVGDAALVGHLSGGILAWIDQVEPGLQRY